MTVWMVRAGKYGEGRPIWSADVAMVRAGYNPQRPVDTMPALRCQKEDMVMKQLSLTLERAAGR